jgi:hypothetical protein
MSLVYLSRAEVERALPERAAFIHPGHAMGALAIAAAIHETAKAQGLGTPLAY